MSIRENERIIRLYQRFSAGEASPMEIAELNEFLERADAEHKLFDLLEADYQEKKTDMAEINELRSVQIFKEITSQPQEVRKTRKLWVRFAAAAAILVMISASFFYFNVFFNTGNQSDLAAGYTDLPPGKNAATLTLSNGRKVVLSEKINGELAQEAGVSILKTSGGEILYEINDLSKAKPNQLNILSTARGETYRVKLPDGSTVWLNSGSSLKYPVSFYALKNRSVELEGEAYFDIVKDQAHPFLVKTRGQEVAVLGTSFNIKAYEDEADVITTLQKGSVRVDFQAATWSNRGKVAYGDAVVLNPGQQSLLRGESIRVTAANMEEALAWKEGDFVFNDNDIKSIMRDIARWYNIQVIYPAEIPGGSFSGSVSRNKDISQVLRALESTKLVHFKIEGRRVYVIK